MLEKFQGVSQERLKVTNELKQSNIPDFFKSLNNIDNFEKISISDLSKNDNSNVPDFFYKQLEKSSLTIEQKSEIKNETNWSKEIIENISSIGEYEIYKNAGLIEAKVGDKICLIRPYSDIDINQTDSFGRNNKERMKQGLPPLTKYKTSYELHHIGQHQNSPLAELTIQEHRGKGNDTLLHEKTKESEIDREKFGIERANHWKTRGEMIENE